MNATITALPRLARTLTILGLAVAFAVLVSGDLVAGQDQNAEVIEAGRTVYAEQCASCHGAEGKGDGSAARFLQPKPRDFTAQEWKYAEGGTVEAIAGVVTDGIDDTAMTPFNDVLSAEQINAVATYVVNVLVGGDGR